MAKIGTETSNGGATGAGAPTIDPATGGWRLGNGSLFVMPKFNNMPANSFPYADLAAQMQDAYNMQGQGAGAFNNNAAGRYAFGGPGFGTMNPKAAAGQGLLAFGNGGGGPGGYNPFLGRGNGPFLPPGGGPGTTPPGGGGTLPPITLPPPGGTAPPGTTPPGTTPPGVTPPGSTAPSPYPGYGPPPTGAPWPGWGENFAPPPAANNTKANQALTYLALANGNQSGLLSALNGNQIASNQMVNNYGAQSSNNWNPQAVADAGRGESGGISTLMPAIKSMYESMGIIANGKWVKKQDNEGNWVPV